MDKNKVELLAPAGSLESLKWAILYGADAIYVGGPGFGLRANAMNFTLEELRTATAFVHEHQKKLYVTVNIVMHHEEVEKLDSYLKSLEEIGVDAIIVSDPAIIDYAKKHTKLELHVSTQQSTLNRYGASYLKKLGASRIVLAREASKEDIIDMIESVDIEIETFIHGAMCASYSGRCVLSNYLTARDSNRGGCSQICRWDFDLLEDGKETKGEKPFTFCTKDLSMVTKIPEMIDMGITSFKIEGRMRSIYYIATVVSTYRNLIDAYYEDKLTSDMMHTAKKILDAVANRESTVQFFDGNFGKSCQYYNGRMEASNQDFLGIVLEYDKSKKWMKVEQRNYFKVGDTVEIFGPNHFLNILKISHIYDEEGNEISIVNHPRQIVYIKTEETVHPNDLMRMKKSI
ncbi:MAG: U32 family peptidase [Firmicutes bacterium]|nr:U32 family peptidase [Bacillota bacterium]